MRNPLRARRRASKPGPTPPPSAASSGNDFAPDLSDFTADLFRHFGAEVRAIDRRKKQGALYVALPIDLAERFGGDHLNLAFQSVEEGSGQQLVAHGSRTFDRMMALLRGHSTLTVRRLPVRHLGSESLLQGVRPRNAGIANLRLHEQQEALFAFHWRLTYRADDKREELHTVVVDSQGARLALGEQGALPNLETLLADSTPATVDAEADAEGEAATAHAADAPLRLPAMAHLVRLAERARKFAVYHADVRCVAHEAEILPRLYKVLDRLTNYYAQQVEEVGDSRDPTGERRAALAADLERKIAEEIENHRLRVQVELVACAILHLPVASAEMTLRNGRREATLQVRLDRYTGRLYRPTCHACGQEMEAVALDRNGHLHCEGCLRQCEACQEALCASCGVEPCPACGKSTCTECGRECLACGGRACAEHISRCPICADEVCHDCQVECAHCGVLQCRSHLRADAVREADGSTRLVCATCAIRCPGCHQFSARLGICSRSGQRYCTNCLVVCSLCGRSVGPGFHAIEAASGLPVCQSCAKLCPACGRVSNQEVTCRVCKRQSCSACSRSCAVCSEHACADHWSVAEGCGHILCAEHALACAIGGEPVCPTCSRPCVICERPMCVHHQRPCGWCGRVYCIECVGAESGLCRTCRSLHQQSPIDIDREEVISTPDVAALAPRYEWRRASNADVTVYQGEGAIDSVLVVVRRLRTGRLLVITRRLSGDELLKGKLTR